jgi:hypothetical protein
MRKDEYMKTLNEVQELIGKVKSVNEAIQFNEDNFDNEFGGAEEEPQVPAEEAPEQNQDMAAAGSANLASMKPEERTEEDGLRELGEVDTIREIALKGMIKLCKNPEDERYQALKKIFQFCDKAAESKDKENM